MEGVTNHSREWREREDIWWSQRLNRSVTPRNMMQWFGTELVRGKINNKFWVARTELDIISTQGDVVVSDLRFPEEIDLIRELGGTVVRVKRGDDPSYFPSARWLNSNPKYLQPLLLPFMKSLKGVHESERAWIGCEMDYVISNSGTLLELKREVDLLIPNLRTPIISH
jgi:hypothetical protein